LFYQDMDFDLSDTTKWEYLLVGADRIQTEIPDADEELYDLDDEEQENEEEKHLDMPASWTLPIIITNKQYETRCA